MVVVTQVSLEVVVQAEVLSVTGNASPGQYTTVDVGGDVPEFAEVAPVDDEANRGRVRDRKEQLGMVVRGGGKDSGKQGHARWHGLGSVDEVDG